MAATTDRQAARERLLALAKAEIDRLVPLDESIPLQGQYFADFEDQTDALEPLSTEEIAARLAPATVCIHVICE